jgi:TRAP-type transport system periplasmic protein
MQRAINGLLVHLAGVLAVCGFVANPAAGKVVTIKMATLAPEGTSWVNYLREFEAELGKATDNQVKLKLYPGGVMGDENVVLQKLRAGQLSGAGFTGIGLGQIESSERILDMPFLFNGYSEIDHVVSKVSDKLKDRFKAQGYTLLGWTEAGLVHFFSKSPINSLDALKSVKMWAWNSDPMVKIMFDEFDIKPIPLELPDVPMSLDTGIITACYATPLAALALQWAPRIGFITEQNMAYSSGGLVVQTKIVDSLSKEHQKILLEFGEKYSKLITVAVRKENDAALSVFKNEGKKLVQFDQSQAKAVVDKSRTIRKGLAGKMFSKELHNDVIRFRNEFRTSELARLEGELAKLKKGGSSASKEAHSLESSISEIKLSLSTAKLDMI